MGEDIKRRLLFVDDEADILTGLKRTLRSMHKQWEMTFADSGAEALKILAKSPFDVVVTDMRMPGMDGAQLLSEVLIRYPGIVRIVLSGHSDNKMILKSVGLAHQYLAKPCDMETLKAVVTETCAFRDLLTHDSLKEKVSQLKSLPSFPDLYFEVIEALKSPDSTMDKIGGIISRDISMTAKMLQLINSAFFGLPQRISNPTQAVKLLGMDIVRTLVLSTHIFSHYERSSKTNFSIEALWNHSTLTAICAKEIFKTECNDKHKIDEAFMAGMLHDIGLVILATNLPEKYNETIELINNNEVSVPEAEQQILETSHEAVGGYLLGLWGLPDSIVEAVFFHHSPQKSSKKYFTPLTAVHVASAIESDMRNNKKLTSAYPINEAYLEDIGMLDHLPKWMETCHAALKAHE